MKSDKKCFPFKSVLDVYLNPEDNWDKNFQDTVPLRECAVLLYPFSQYSSLFSYSYLKTWAAVKVEIY